MASLNNKRKLWLDALPSEVHHRIVSHLAPVPGDPESYYPYLHLAETSRSLHAVILVALSFKLRITRRLEHIDRWATLLTPSLRQLEISVSPKGHHSPTIQLVKAPLLSHLTMVARPDLLRALEKAPEVRVLSLTVYNRLYMKHVFKCLKTLNKLTELVVQLKGRRNDGVGCCLLPQGEDHQDMALCCPHVSKLDVKCRCYNSERCMAWRFAYALPGIRELTLRQGTVPWFLDYDFDEGMYDNSILLLPRFRHPVNKLAVEFTLEGVTYHASFEDSCVVQAPETFAMTLQTGAKLIFPCSPSTLNSFEVRWPSKIWLGEYMYPKEHHEHEHGSLLRSIQEMPVLSVLSLNEVRIQLHELASILAHLGTRLLGFGATIEGQSEEPDERLKALMEIVGTHNTSLEVLSLDFHLVTKYRQHSGINSSEMIHREGDVRAAYRDMLWKCPRVQIVDRDVSRVRSYAEIESIVFGDICEVDDD